VIKCNANIDIVDANGWSGLHHAVKNGDMDTVKLLLKSKAKIGV
jgi:ankyrin repeat protein